MIIKLRGIVEHLLPTSLELTIGGVTYFVEISLNTRDNLKEGQEISLFIAQIIKEDSHNLYGFYKKEERDLFLRILKVSGVGAKIALAILSTYTVSQFLSIIAKNDLNSLKLVKGVGAKVAGKIILEMSGFIIKEEVNEELKLAKNALNSLGFKDSEIIEILKSFDKSLTSNELVKEFLKKIGK